MHKGSTRNLLPSQSNVDKHVISSIYWAWISSCGYMLIFFFCPGMFSKIKTFPQCIPYMYILIYIKGNISSEKYVYKSYCTLYREHKAFALAGFLFCLICLFVYMFVCLFVCSVSVSVSTLISLWNSCGEESYSTVKLHSLGGRTV